MFWYSLSFKVLPAFAIVTYSLAQVPPTPAAPDLVGFFFTTYNFTYIFLGVRSLRCCAGFSLVGENRGCSLIVVHGLLIAVTSLVEHRI